MVNEIICYYTIKHEMPKEMISILSAQTSNWLELVVPSIKLLPS